MLLISHNKLLCSESPVYWSELWVNFIHYEYSCHLLEEDCVFLLLKHNNLAWKYIGISFSYCIQWYKKTWNMFREKRCTYKYSICLSSTSSVTKHIEDQSSPGVLWSSSKYVLSQITENFINSTVFQSGAAKDRYTVSFSYILEHKAVMMVKDLPSYLIVDALILLNILPLPGQRIDLDML